MGVESRSERILTVFRLVEEILEEPCRDVVPSFGYSREHLCGLLNATIGEPIKPLSLRLRLERAAYRLRFDRASVADAGYEAGYVETEAFIKAFRLRFGISPGKFRSMELLEWR